eukprot:GILK01026077.1.p1 GENE.GILK01026077.1~~GILK01026077.1.p1  ORF type:complete len:140 (+),score=1.66 GILK01026077.1:194-613(+)
MDMTRRMCFLSTLSLSVSPSLFLYLSISVSLSLFSISISLYLCLYLYFSMSISLSISLSISISISLSLFLFSISLSLPSSLYFISTVFSQSMCRLYPVLILSIHVANEYLTSRVYTSVASCMHQVIDICCTVVRCVPNV